MSTSSPTTRASSRYLDRRPSISTVPESARSAPYSNRAVVTEYWELHTLPNKDEWLTVTTKVEDAQYFTRPYLTSSDFKKLPGSAGWNPTPCSVK